tara:strand:- start:1039 stop:1629 length:591 start_codon:yes stop_codon:yes gene_type:complete
MRNFLFIIVLIFSFQSWSKAESITDFEIQGVSIGDSLLKIFSKKEIEKFINNENQVNFYPNSKKFFTLSAPSVDKNYRQINVDLKHLDKKFIIYGISQYKRSKIQECLELKKIAVKEIKNLFSSNVKQEEYKKKHSGDKTGNSMTYATEFNFSDDSSINIVCTDWGKEFESNGYRDNLDMGMASAEFYDWLVNEAY